jgi:CP family cyanate transporter-like MFS transporter
VELNISIQAPAHRAASAWVVILAGVTAAMHVGKLPPALPALQAALGITLVQAGFMLSLVQLAGVALGLMVGLSADSMGLKRSLVAGLFVLALASGLGGYAHDITTLLVLRAIEGVGFLLVSMPAPSLIRQLVPAQRLSVMLGFWGTFMPLGTALALLCGPVVIAVLDWSGWWQALAVGTLLVTVFVGWILPPDGHRAMVAVATSQGWRGRLMRTLGSKGPWLVALMFGMYSGQWLSVIGFLPTMCAQAGIVGMGAAVVTALVAAVNMVGNIASGHLQSRGVAPTRLLMIGFATMALGACAAFAAWPLTPDGASLPPLFRLIAVLAFSGVGGLIPSTLFSMAVRVAPDSNAVSTTVGWMQQWSSIGQFSGPPLVAGVASLVGGWHWTWGVTGSLAALGWAMAWGLGRWSRL